MKIEKWIERREREETIVTGLVFERLDPCSLRHLCYQKTLSKPMKQSKKGLRNQVSNNKRYRERTLRMLDCISKLGCSNVYILKHLYFTFINSIYFQSFQLLSISIVRLDGWIFAYFIAYIHCLNGRFSCLIWLLIFLHFVMQFYLVMLG